MSLSTSVDAIWRPLVATLVLVLVVVLIASALHLTGLTVLSIAIWLNVVGVLAVGLFLILRANRLYAGLGSIICALSILLAFFWVPDPSPFVWTIGLFVGVGLIIYGTRADTLRSGLWPLVIARVIFGWAWIDNAQDHLRTGWLPGGGAFATLAKAAVDRKPTYFLDPLYQSFAAGTLLPSKDLWAGLTASGELTFGFLLLIGLFGSLAASGLLWHSLNYILVKGAVVHGAYTDKAFFAADLLCLVSAAGLVYGLDASVSRHVPASVAEILMGVGGNQPAAVSQPRPQLGGIPAT
jgi:uncharacterized membrane protein YphA (DoxX/SURF4 family)